MSQKVADKVRENRLRRMAARQGLTVCKSRTRDPRALDYGCYHITDDRNVVVAGAAIREFDMSLDKVERFLMDDTRPRYRKGEDGKLRWHIPQQAEN